MHRFDPDKEPPTILIEVNPRRYATVGRTEVNKDGKTVLRSRQDGRDDTTMIFVQGREPGLESRMWVPPRIADDLTAAQPAGRAGDMPCVARVIGKRTVDEAKAGVEPEDKPKGPVRRKVG